jgi:hypothetical protein
MSNRMLIEAATVVRKRIYGPGRLGLIVPCGGIMLADKLDSRRLCNGIRNMTVAC